MQELTDEQRQAAILDEIGDEGGFLATKIATQWAKYAALASASPDLRDLYVKRGLIDIAYGRARTAVDFTNADHSQKASQEAGALLKLREQVTAAIDALTGTLADAANPLAAGLAAGELTTVSPESPPHAPLPRPYGPDALDPGYLGSPYYGTGVRGPR